MANITINSLDSTIQDILNDYKKEVADGVKEVTHKVSNELKKDTQRDAPRGRRKKFYRHIAIKKVRETQDGAVDMWYVKDPEYRLTHLIKNGHQKRNGGRTKSNDFIDRNYEKAEKNFEEKIKEVITNGG